MSELAEKLSGRKFVRVSRPAWVNLEHVREWQPLFNGDSVVRISTGEQVRVSRNCRERLLRSLEG